MYPTRPSSRQSYAPPPPRPSSPFAFSSSRHSASTPRTLPPINTACYGPRPPSPYRLSSPVPFLPSFAGGKELPLPKPSGIAHRRGSDPRDYTSSGRGDGGRTATVGGGFSAVGRGERRLSISPSDWTTTTPLSDGAGQPGRRPPSPSRHASIVTISPPRPVSALATARSSSHPFPPPPPRPASTAYYRPVPVPAASRPAPPRPPTPPLVPTSAGRPSSESSRCRRISQVEPNSPTILSLPPSPNAPALPYPSERHHSTHLNEPGYRSLVRRSSISSSSSPHCSHSQPSSSTSSSIDAGTRARLPPLPLPLPSTASALARRPSLNHHHPLEPLYTLSSATDGGRASSPSKRTNFSLAQVRVLNQLWDARSYYPNSGQVEEAQKRTGLTRTQVRNYFANRRQRSTGEEKIRVQTMGRELSLVSWNSTKTNRASPVDVEKKK